MSYGFIETCRQVEIEGVRGGRRNNEFTVAPVRAMQAGIVGVDDESVVFRAADDILETEDRAAALDTYVPFVSRAFEERGLQYPFQRQGNCLIVRPGRAARSLAEKVVALAELSGVGGQSAKTFELRATKALHRFVGGHAVIVGAPRRGRTGAARAVRQFRRIVPSECGTFLREHYPPGGDFNADAFFILGRDWGGPLVFVQVKNSGFDPTKFAGDVIHGSASFNDWFGRRLDKVRHVVPVFAVNTVLTHTAKENAFQNALAGSGYHVLDCVDILCAEVDWPRIRQRRDRLTIM